MIFLKYYILMKKQLLFLVFTLLYVFNSFTQDKTNIYVLNIKQEIGQSTWRHTQKAFKKAKENNSDILLIHMNTYGGAVDAADSIRSKILNSDIPVYVFINNNAASAGALISVACDSIYMCEGAKIGAATVVTQSGEKAPDKYQSYMRATMRATAEAKAKDTIFYDNDTIIKWRRNPLIAEAMVDEDIYIKDVIDSAKILTFTTNEAIENNYCEAKVKDIDNLLKHAGILNYNIEEYKPDLVESIIGFLVNPIIHSLLIMLIIGGLYFELQSPGIGFPLVASIIAAVLYFAPLYLEGMAQNWEIIIFVIGVILVALEIFVVPGFGVTGISGIVFVIAGLTLSLIDNNIFEYNTFEYGVKVIFEAFALVIISLTLSFILSIFLGKKLLLSTSLNQFILKKTQNTDEGYIAVKVRNNIVGNIGKTITDLRPSGKIMINNEVYDSIAEFGYIEKDKKIIVSRFETGQAYVKENV